MWCESLYFMAEIPSRYLLFWPEKHYLSVTHPTAAIFGLAPRLKYSHLSLKYAN